MARGSTERLGLCVSLAAAALLHLGLIAATLYPDAGQQPTGETGEDLGPGPPETDEDDERRA